METHEELEQLANELKRVASNHSRATTVLAILIVVTCLAVVYLARFYIDKSVHEAIQDENISAQIETGFDRVMENYEIAQ